MEKNKRQREKQHFWKETEQEKQYLRAKRQCVVLGILVIIMAGILVKRSFFTVNEPVWNPEGVTGGSTGQVRIAEQYNIDEKSESDSEKTEKRDHLLLVNKEHELPKDYQVELHWLNNRSCAVAEMIYEDLKQMLTDGSVDGREFVVASGYRSRDYQEELLTEDIAAAMKNQGLSWQEAYDQETKETMPPGCSEHETGLAVDIVALDYQKLDERQEGTPENQWLLENCHKYGFILRYPEDKEGITGVSYEPWHFRYVGKDAAKEIMEQGITMEEYLGEVR